MPAKNAIRINDMTSGHSCFPPQRIKGGSENVFANKRNVVRQGDYVEPHTCGMAGHYTFTEIKDKENIKYTVFVNGIPPSKLNDKMEEEIGYDVETDEPVECLSKIITGSSNVFFGV